MSQLLRSTHPTPDWLIASVPSLARGEACRYDAFVQAALYHPQHGYYQKDRDRVGRTPDHDFATASSVGPMFGQLVRSAAAQLADLAGLQPSSLTLLELGAESHQGVFLGEPGPFAGVETRRLGQSMDLPPRCVVFSNELFDAQTFRRFLKTDQGWREILLQLDADGHLNETLGEPISDVSGDATDGWILDWPNGSETLLNQLVSQKWTGVFIAFDYGKNWDDFLTDNPEGTARAYRRQTQHNRLLDHPGEQDLTCHVAWDRLSKLLSSNGFSEPRLQRQESFFLHHARPAIENVFLSDADPLSTRRRSLATLLHPAHFGARFQVLHASRTV